MANSAELSALIWAMSYALQFCGESSHCCSVHIFYDCLVAGHGADGLWKCDGLLATVAKSLHNVLTASVPLLLEHEYGHTNNPSNEYCDGVCTLFNGSRSEAGFFLSCEATPVRGLALRTAAVQWYFIAALCPADQAQYPYCDGDGLMALSSAVCPVARLGVDTEVISSFIDDFQKDDALSVDQCRQDIVSPVLQTFLANACTLRAARKRSVYYKQIKQRAVHKGVFLEARGKHSGVYAEGAFTVAESCCDANGSGGVVVVISNKLAFAHPLPSCSLPLVVAEADVNIIVSKPQLLIVKIAAPRYQQVIVAIHGPDLSYGSDFCEEFYGGAYSDVAACTKADDNILFLVDGKCRITERQGHEDTCVGTVLDPQWRHTFLTDHMVHFFGDSKLRLTARSATTCMTAILKARSWYPTAHR